MTNRLKLIRRIKKKPSAFHALNRHLVTSTGFPLNDNITDNSFTPRPKFQGTDIISLAKRLFHQNAHVQLLLFSSGFSCAKFTKHHIVVET